MTDIIEVADGQLIEPPLTVEQRLAEHCAYAEKDFTNGDYFHLLAKDSLALIASQAARIRELEEGVRPLSLAASLMSGDPDDRVVSVGRWYDYDDGNPPRFGADVQLTVGHFRRARSLLSRKGGE